MLHICICKVALRAAFGNKREELFAAAIVRGAVTNLIHAAREPVADGIIPIAPTPYVQAEGTDNDFGYGLLNTKAAEAAKQDP